MILNSCFFNSRIRIRFFYHYLKRNSDNLCINIRITLIITWLISGCCRAELNFLGGGSRNFSSMLNYQRRISKCNIPMVPWRAGPTTNSQWDHRGTNSYFFWLILGPPPPYETIDHTPPTPGWRDIFYFLIKFVQKISLKCPVSLWLTPSLHICQLSCTP